MKTKKLHTFYDDRIPPYAILSHQWGKDEDEVTFAQIQDLESCRQIVGYRKIEYMCQQAARDGWQYAWCDTCCMTSSSVTLETY